MVQLRMRQQLIQAQRLHSAHHCHVSISPLQAENHHAAAAAHSASSAAYAGLLVPVPLLPPTKPGARAVAGAAPGLFLAVQLEMRPVSVSPTMSGVSASATASASPLHPPGAGALAPPAAAPAKSMLSGTGIIRAVL
jgi:hypothetical protein